MAAFNFPASPSNGDTYTLNSVTYQYDGTKWVRYSAAVGAQGATGSAGAQGAQGSQGHQGLQGAQAHISTSAPSSGVNNGDCLLYTSPSPRDRQKSRMPSSA